MVVCGRSAERDGRGIVGGSDDARRSEMPVEYVVLNQGALVLELWTGIISHDELLTHEERHLNDSSIARGASVLADDTMPRSRRRWRRFMN